jgi:signal transduction histidine kinase
LAQDTRSGHTAAMAVTAAASTPVTPAPTGATRAKRIGADALYVLLGLVASIIAFTVWITAASVTLSLIILIIGLPLVLLSFGVFRVMCNAERRRAALVFGEPIDAYYRPVPRGTRFGERLRIVTTDPQSWKDTAYLLVLSVVGFTWGVIWLTLWGYAIGSLTLPAWWWALPDDATYLWFHVETWPQYAGVVAIGLALIPVSLYAQRGMALSEAHIAKWLLAPSLAERVERLTETRAGAVDAAAAELQRIERDLHDGAQARLVALAMDLGMAEERFERDPESARELVGEAREEAKRALAELRDLARGIRPGMLAERGLDAAIHALAARSPVPAKATVDVPRRPPTNVESAAWFVVSEALANTAKHSQARRATVLVTLRNDHLHVEVVDDGRGGADPRGAGLRGLAQRVEALDGSLEVNSPPGGPTVVRAVLPCA